VFDRLLGDGFILEVMLFKVVSFSLSIYVIKKTNRNNLSFFWAKTFLLKILESGCYLSAVAA